MGLSAPRKRTKLSHDPNNTKWTSDTAGFGHRIMTSQGWQPGQYLGAKDASQAEFYTAANISHIRVVNREDNLGIGMDPRKVVEPKSTGLDAFQDLLGRLNGKEEEEILKEQKSREDLKRAIYSESRWGSTRFVRGGFLIGDKIQHLIDAEADRIRMLADVPSNTSEDFSINDRSSEDSESEAAPKAAVAKRKKAKKMKQIEAQEDEVPRVARKATVVASDGKLPKAKKKRRREETEKFADGAVQIIRETANAKPKSKKKSKKSLHNEYVIEVEPSKAEKRKRKEKALVREVDVNENEGPLSNSSKPNQEINIQESGKASSAVIEQSRTSNFHLPAPSTPQSLLGSRHAVRSRNIAQKRMAVLDTAALNQIFMIKQ